MLRKIFFLVENKKLYVITEFQVKITIKSKVIKEKLCKVGHNQKFCQK